MIREARPAELSEVGELVARAFDPLRQARVLVPDPLERLPILAGFVTLAAWQAYSSGRVDIIEGPHGAPAAAAIWFDRTAGAAPPSGYAARLAAVTLHRVAAFTALTRLLDRHRPQGPHWRLGFLAVHPDHQRAGLGSALLEHGHLFADADVYLEAMGGDSVRFYRRHGYRGLDPYEVRLPDGTPFYRLHRPALPRPR